ncbi:MAG: cation transporter, partial [Dokdonella sp.]
AILVTVWAVGLLRDTGKVLLDAEMDAPVVEEVREVIADCDPAAIVTDLHVWRVGKGKFSCVVSLVTHSQLSADDFRAQLSVHEELVHVTVETTSIPV